MPSFSRPYSVIFRPSFGLFNAILVLISKAFLVLAEEGRKDLQAAHAILHV